MRKLIITAVVIATLGLAGCSNSDSDGESSDKPIKVGALLDLTGPGKTLGIASKAALEAGVIDAKADGVTVELTVVDTGSVPATALSEMQSLFGKGIHAFVGPQSSSEAREILPAAQEAGAIIVSQGSTASSLAFDNDALFRMLPTDVVEGKAAADLITSGVKTYAVVAHRDDAGNNGLAKTVTGDVTANGGIVIPGPSYAPDATNFGPIAALIGATIDGARAEAKAAGGETRVVLYLAGFDEVASIATEAAKLKAFDGIPWFGGDGSAQSAALIANASTDAFLVEQAAGYDSPLPTLGRNKKPPSDALNAALNPYDKIDDPLPLGAYDALMLIIEAQQSAGTTAIGPKLWSAFATAAETYTGVTGATVLNSAGDRASGEFGYWGVCVAEAGFEWHMNGTWVPPKASATLGTIEYWGCGKDSVSK